MIVNSFQIAGGDHFPTRGNVQFSLACVEKCTYACMNQT